MQLYDARLWDAYRGKLWDATQSNLAPCQVTVYISVSTLEKGNLVTSSQAPLE